MDYSGFAAGVSKVPSLWQYGVHAFPDLATGSPAGYPALSLKPFSEETSRAAKIYGGRKWGALGLEWQLAALGQFPMGFEIAGDFGAALNRTSDNGGPVPGRMYERGNIDILAPAISGTYTKDIGNLSLMAKLGLAMPITQTNTMSTYDLNFPSKEHGNVAKNHAFVSLAPLFGLSATYPLNKDWKARLEAEHYKDVQVSNSHDPAYKDKKKAGINSLWFGLERAF